MAPEQSEHPSEVDHRADLYALGVVFYQMLTGELPKGQIEPPSHKVVLDVRLDEVVLRALDRDPSRRYQQASALKAQIETIAGTPAPETSSPSRPASTSPMLKTGWGRFTTEEFLATPGGGLRLHPGFGELTLLTDRLMLTCDSEKSEIPLAAIREIGLAVCPWWMSPVGHRFLSVVYDDADRQRRVLFLEGSAFFRSARDTELRANAWLAAIRNAVKTANGRELPAASGVPTVVPASPRGALLVFLPLLLVTGLLLWTGLRSGGRTVIWPELLVLVAVPWLSFLAIAFWTLRRRAKGNVGARQTP